MEDLIHLTKEKAYQLGYAKGLSKSMQASQTYDVHTGLQKHLWKCELEYRVKHFPAGSSVDWLSEECSSPESIATFLRFLGFKIKEIVDEEDSFGEKHQWVITTSGIIVYVNNEYCHGLVAASKHDSRIL